MGRGGALINVPLNSWSKAPSMIIITIINNHCWGYWFAIIWRKFYTLPICAVEYCLVVFVDLPDLSITVDKAADCVHCVFLLPAHLGWQGILFWSYKHSDPVSTTLDTKEDFLYTRPVLHIISIYAMLPPIVIQNYDSRYIYSVLLPL